MPLCDLCGKDTKLVIAEVEAAKLKVCQNCARYGSVLEADKPDEELFHAPQPRHTPEPATSDETIDENYALIIKNAREGSKLTQEDLAQAIAEKENVIHRIETRQQEPPIKVAKKLEQFLKIKLIIKPGQQRTTLQLKNLDFSETNLTIGDLLKMNKKIKDPSK